MPKPYRRKPTRINEMPSLWDAPAADEKQKDPVRSIIDKHRAEQITPEHPLSPAQMERRVQETSARQRVLEFISFGNGSSGNCAYLGVRGHGGILIDAGVEADKVLAVLSDNYIPLDRISGILLTHDHSDHVRYVYNLLRKNPRMLVYCTPRTLTGILRRHNITRRVKDYHKAIYKEFEFDAGPFKVIPFEVSHDGADNVGFSIGVDDRHFVVATDMGKITDRADHYMRAADYLMIESNYDEHMLTVGRYPEYLKARIRGDLGHLGNDVAAAYLAEIWQPRLTDVYLCHLSNDNNTPEIAFDTTRKALAARGVSVGDGSGSAIALQAQVQVSTLPRFEASPLYIHRL